MTAPRGYAQFCPIAIAAEVVAERWTPLVLRALCQGATRYGEIRDSVPRMSTALLSRRLEELERAGVIVRRPRAEGRGYEYLLTEPGRELFPVLEQMGFWAQKWLRHEVLRDENLDPYALMWELRRAARGTGPAGRRRVAAFRLSGVPADKRFYWLVLEDGDADICTRDPGHEVDIWITARMRDLVEVWLGHKTLAAAREEGSVELDGSPGEIAEFGEWFVLSHFATAAE